jgi:ComF family protein
VFLTRTAELLYDSLLSLLYPQTCDICNNLVGARSDGIACQTCWDKVRFYCDEDTLCWKCGAPSRVHVKTEDRECIRCRNCDDDQFTAARACGEYEGALRCAVLALKREPFVCKRLIELLVGIQSRVPLNRATVIIPVPLHPERQRTRGFNQAEVIAHELSRSCHLPVNHLTLVRVIHTERHRAGMDLKGRRQSVANAFAVRHPGVIEGERVLLIDDVYTTGATASSVGRVLVEAGATEIFVLTLARAPQPIS